MDAEQALPVVDSVSDYEKIKRIGEGTYGVVYKARDRTSGEIVALKKLRMDMERNGMPVTSVRELRVLQSCRHPNLVELKKVVTGKKLDSVFLVFEYCAHDLGRLVDTMSRPFKHSEVKCLMVQLLEGIDYLHSRWVFHRRCRTMDVAKLLSQMAHGRDLKLSNLLLTHDGTLKLCDFGLARSFRAFQEAYTPRVVTLWYRCVLYARDTNKTPTSFGITAMACGLIKQACAPDRAPEILLGQDTYTEAVDMWAAGCIFGELLRNEPLFPARAEVDTLELMARLLGAPNERIWPGFSKLPHTSKIKFPDQPYNYVEKEFSGVSAAGLDLLNRLLTYDPARRLTARAAVRHPYLTAEAPLPKRPTDMPTFPSAHDQDARGWHARRAEAEAAPGKRGGSGRGARDAQRDMDNAFGDAFGAAPAAKRARLAQR